MRFAVMGVGGYIAKRHIEAIKSVGGDLVAACDPHDSVGHLDSTFPMCRFFTEPERFARHLWKMRRLEPIDLVSVCTPNHLHDAHARLAMTAGSDAIIEKPACIKPHNVEQLMDVELETGRRAWCVLQARLHPEAVRLFAMRTPRPHVNIDYSVSRGWWYDQSWKGDHAKSGGPLMNIGVHMVDLICARFGRLVCVDEAAATPRSVTANAEFEGCTVTLSLNVRPAGSAPVRVFRVGTESFDFSTGFEALHAATYREIIASRGFRLHDALPAIQAVDAIMRKAQQ